MYRTGPEKSIVFLWALHVDIFIGSENRHKVNEFVIARPDISTILMYRRRKPVADSEIVLIREFRSSVSNETGFVWELAGGSSFKGKIDPKKLAADECKEEAGITIDPSRIKQHEVRQMVATLSAHKAHLFSVELTEKELVQLKAQHGVAHGIVEDSEQTYTEILTLKQILERPVVDWSMLGMILSVLQ
jgi:8-oxo-dGTP pyrophosphatase MutT (NUDIX family)